MFPFTIKPALSNVNLKPIIASIPHCGTHVPLDIKARFANAAQRSLPMTDWYLQYLYDFLPRLGVTVLHANISRNVIDLNRSPTPIELYPGRFETKLVADKTFQGEEIFSHYPTNHQINQNIINVHAPYHRSLDCLLRDRLKQFDKVYLLDLHSIAPFETLVHPRLEKDIYLGNRDNESCDQAWLSQVQRLYENCGFSTEVNHPYKGGYITHHYGKNENIEALQIEMNQIVYLEGHERPRNHADMDIILRDRFFRSAKRKLEILFTTLVEQMNIL